MAKQLQTRHLKEVIANLILTSNRFTVDLTSQILPEMKYILPFFWVLYCSMTPLYGQYKRPFLSDQIQLSEVSGIGISSVKDCKTAVSDQFLRDIYYPKGSLSAGEWQELQYALAGLPPDPGRKRRANGWEFLGPTIMKTPPVGQGPFTRYAGRVSCVEDLNYLRVSGSHGGLWQYVSAGTWFPISEELPFQYIGAFASNPQNPSTIVVGTGEYSGESSSFYPQFQVSRGIYITRNGGATWTQCSMNLLGSAYPAVKKIFFVPTDTSKIFAVTSQGLYYTSNGINWWFFNQNFHIGIITDLAQSADNLHYLIGRVGTGATALYGDAGLTGGGGTPVSLGTEFNVNNKFPGDYKFAYAPSQPNIVYASCFYYDDSASVIFRSTNFGAPGSWQRCSIVNDNNQPLKNIHNAQGFRDNCIAVCPSDANIVLAGGVGFVRSANGNVFKPVNGRHPDYHSIWWKTPAIVYVANDGGVYRSTDSGKTWSDQQLDYLPLSQSYFLDVARMNAEHVLSGLQDNGLVIYNPLSLDFEHTFWGDGGAVAFDPARDSVCYATIGVHPDKNAFRRYRSGQYGQAGTWLEIENGVDTTRQFNAPIACDFVFPSYQYTTSGPRAYVSQNQGQQWICLNPNNLFPRDSRHMAVSLTNSPNVYLSFAPDPNASWMGTRMEVTGANATFDSLTSFELGLFPPEEYLRACWTEWNHTNTDTAILAIGGLTTGSGKKVIKTNSNASSWYNCTGNLPSLLPATSIVANPNRSAEMVLGTTEGCYKTDNDGVTWYNWSYGLPRGLLVSDMKLAVKNGKRYVVISTFGRGIWQRELSDQEPAAVGIQMAPERQGSLQVFPNPASNAQTLEFSLGSESRVDGGLYSMQGQVVQRISPVQLSAGVQVINADLSALTPGTYIWVVRVNGMVFRRKVSRQ